MDFTVNRLSLSEIKHYLDFNPEMLKEWDIDLASLINKLVEFEEEIDSNYVAVSEFEELEERVDYLEEEETRLEKELDGADRRIDVLDEEIERLTEIESRYNAIKLQVQK